MVSSFSRMYGVQRSAVSEGSGLVLLSVGNDKLVQSRDQAGWLAGREGQGEMSDRTEIK